MENAKIQKFKWDILSNFQTTCEGSCHIDNITYQFLISQIHLELVLLLLTLEACVLRIM